MLGRLRVSGDDTEGACIDGRQQIKLICCRLDQGHASRGGVGGADRRATTHPRGGPLGRFLLSATGPHRNVHVGLNVTKPPVSYGFPVITSNRIAT